MGASLKPSTASDAVGMEGPVRIDKLRFEEFDYKNKEGQSVAPGIGMMLRGVDPTGEDKAQFYSIGKQESWEPSGDGKEITHTSDPSRTPVKTCHFMLFMNALDNAGYNVEENVDDDISVMEGLIVDFQAVALPSFDGGQPRPKPMPNKLLADAGEKNEWTKKFANVGSGGDKGSRRGARGSATSTGSRRKKGGKSRIDALTHGYLVDLLEKDYDEIGRDELADIMLKKAKHDDNRKDIVERVYEEDFLTGHPDDWEYVDETVYALTDE